MPAFSRKPPVQELIRLFLERTDELSTADFPKETGVSTTSRYRLRDGSWKRPNAGTVQKVRAYLQRVGVLDAAGMLVEEGAGAPQEPPPAPSVDVASLSLPTVNFLKPRARSYYDARLGSYLQRHWPLEVVERVAGELVASFVGANAVRASGAGRADLSEDEQLMVLEAIAQHVEDVYGPNGQPRRV